MRILLAEDSAVYRHLTGNLLREWGFDVVIAKDGAEAWKLLQEQQAPNLVLLDWVLPEIDGVELCRRIRRATAGGGIVCGKAEVCVFSFLPPQNRHAERWRMDYLEEEQMANGETALPAAADRRPEECTRR